MSRLRLSSSARPILLSLAFVLTYLLLTRPEVLVIYRLGSVAWYPVIGVVFGLLLGVSPWYAPVVAVAVAIAGRVTYEQSFYNFGETIGAVTLAGSYAGAAHLLRGPLRIDFRLTHRRDVVRYLYVSFSAAAINALMGAACLAADHSVSWHEFWPAALAWFFGDGIALVAIGPFLLIFVSPRVRQWTFRESPIREHSEHDLPSALWSLETLAQAVTIVLVVALMFGIAWGRYYTFFLGFVPVIWVAVRQGMRRVVVALVVLNVVMVLAMDLAPPPAELLTKISLLMLVLSSVGLIVGAEVSERSRMAINLHEQTSYLNALIENSPLGIVVFNQQGRVEFPNPAFENLILYKRQDLVIGDIATLWLEGMAEALPQALAGQACHRTVRQKRKDGKTLDLALHAVPLAVKGQVRGVYAIYEDVSEQVRAAEAERKYAESQRELVAQLQLRTQQMSLLNEMGSLLQRSGTVDEASIVVARCVQKLFPEASSGVLYLFKSSATVLETAAAFGGKGRSENAFRHDACIALQGARDCWSHSGDSALSCQHLKHDVSTISLCVPVASPDANLGLLHLEFASRQKANEDQDAEWQDSQSSLAATVAGEIAISLCSIQLRENLREQAIRDPLTQLYNRRFLEESLGTELQRAKRGHYPVSLLFLDLDHFKRFNDTFGHEAGDTVLRSLAVLLRTFFRASDTCCRAGGEEFAVILPQAAPESATVRANALRLEVKSLQLEHENRPLGSVTVSIGVATFPDHGATPDSLLRIADRCLYDSKARGRDLVTAPKAVAFSGKAGQ